MSTQFISIKKWTPKGTFGTVDTSSYPFPRTNMAFWIDGLASPLQSDVGLLDNGYLAFFNLSGELGFVGSNESLSDLETLQLEVDGLSNDLTALQVEVDGISTGSGFVPITRTINGYDLSTNRTLGTADITDSLNKRYVTDSHLTILGNTSGTNSGDITLVNGTNISIVESPSKTFTINSTAGGSGTVTSVSVVSANGVSGSVATATTTPAITLALGAITPSSVNSIVFTGSTTPTLSVTGTSSITGANTGDNAVNSLYSGLVTNATHTGDATGSGALTVVGINNTIISTLATGIMKNTSGTGVPSIAIAGTDYILPNSPIVAATKTKITYDVNGLVTAGNDATTADIADSLNKRYVTDAHLTVLGNTSGTNTGDQDISGKANLASANFTALFLGSLPVASYATGSNANGSYYVAYNAAGAALMVIQYGSYTVTAYPTTQNLPVSMPTDVYVGIPMGSSGVRSLPTVASYTTSSFGIYLVNSSTGAAVTSGAGRWAAIWVKV